MNREIVDRFLMRTERFEENERIRVEDSDGAIGSGGDEIAREGEGRRSVEGESGDGSGVIVVEERAERRGGREIVEMDCIVGAAGSSDGTGASDGCDWGDVGRVREERR